MATNDKKLKREALGLQMTESDVLRLYDWGEWCDVMEKIFSSDEERVEEAIRTIGQWRVGVGINVAIDATAGLMKARMMDMGREAALAEDIPCNISAEDVGVAYSMTIIRMVNGLTSEIETRGKQARSVKQMAADLQLPTELVDIRHAATHKALPLVQELRIGTSLALDYLFVNYWQAQHQQLLIFQRRHRTESPSLATAAPSRAAVTHPYLVSPIPSAPSTSLTLTDNQLLLKMEVECTSGIDAKVAELERSLGIENSAITVWPVSTVPLAALLQSKRGVSRVDDAEVHANATP